MCDGRFQLCGVGIVVGNGGSHAVESVLQHNHVVWYFVLQFPQSFGRNFYKRSTAISSHRYVVDSDTLSVIEPTSPQCYFGTVAFYFERRCRFVESLQMIREGQGDFLMKGLCSTDKFLRAILNKETGLLPPKGTLTHCTTLEIPSYHKLLFVGDVAVIPAPDLKQKQIIMDCLVKTAKAVGVSTPKVALIAATEQVLGSQPATIDAALLAKMADRGQIKGCIADGPLALDVAIDKESVEIKGLVSPVAGDADCLLFPNIESGNVFYKANSKLVPGVRQAGILVGAKVPCVLSSRADSIDTKLNSIAVAAMSVK